MTWPTGAMYQGTYFKDKMTGFGTYRDESGTVYKGLFLAGRLISLKHKIRPDFDWENTDFGIREYVKGGRYEGQLRYGMRWGQGVMIYPNGNRYEGQWVGEKKHGKGICLYYNGDRYEGEWVDSKKDGFGILTCANGNRYEGQWKQGKRVQGKMFYAKSKKPGYENATYDGQWQNNTWHGKGVFDAPAEHYEGDFFEGKNWGQGVTTYPDGGRHEGKYVKGQRHGYGVMTYPDGSCYEGMWEEDLRCGQGKLTYPDGRVFEGNFVNDEPEET
jgi:hypothetical protein